MRVRCTADRARPVFPDAVSPVVNWSCNVTPGRIYLLLDLTLTPEMMFHGRGVTLEILDDDDDWALARCTCSKWLTPDHRGIGVRSRLAKVGKG